MSKVTIKSGSQIGREIELSPGTVHLGRSEENDISVPEPSISSTHCELNVSDIGVAVRDLGSTNGTFINGERVTKGMLSTGDTLRLGDIEFLVELSDVHIAIPEMQAPDDEGAAFLEDGSQACFRHRAVPALFLCTGCENWWCAECVRPLKRLSGDFLNFCPQCPAACVPLTRENQKSKRSLLQRIGDRLKITPKT